MTREELLHSLIEQAFDAWSLAEKGHYEQAAEIYKLIAEFIIKNKPD